MKFPKYHDRSLETALVAKLIDTIAYTERDVVVRHEFVVDQSSQNLGKVCLAISNGYEPDMADPIDPSQLEPELGIIYQMRKLVDSRYDALNIRRYQRQLHNAGINALSSALHGKQSKLSKVAEYTCLGLLTRYAHPGILAYPTLPHFESSRDTGGYYDIGVITRDSVTRPANSYFIQSKFDCFGICANKTAVTKLQAHQQKYRPLIQLISGCCDLRLGSVSDPDLAIPDLLYKEQQNDITSDEIRSLDDASNNLLLKVSANLLPRGKRSGRSIAINGTKYMS